LSTRPDELRDFSTGPGVAFGAEEYEKMIIINVLITAVIWALERGWGFAFVFFFCYFWGDRRFRFPDFSVRPILSPQV